MQESFNKNTSVMLIVHDLNRTDTKELFDMFTTAELTCLITKDFTCTETVPLHERHHDIFEKKN
jgi:hypothetical protein